MKLTKYIPNILTCLNLGFGFCACILGFSGEYILALYAVIAAALFDFADGMAARSLNSFSLIGKDLDSLSDMVSFGIAPGLTLFSLLDNLSQSPYQWILFPALTIPLFSALRLAKFNNDTRQKTSFIGLPVPANALFRMSLISTTDAIEKPLTSFVFDVNFSPLVAGLSLLALATSLLMISELPMFSLKIRSLNWKENTNFYILIFITAALLFFLGIIGITLTIVFYILMNITLYLFKKKRLSDK